MSRFQLALSPFRQYNGILASSTDNPDSNLEFQKDNLDKLKYYRKIIQSKYPNRINPFSKNQLCRIVKSKENLESIKGGTGLQNSSDSLYRVEEAGPSNCRLTDLSSGSHRTSDFGRLQPASQQQLEGNILQMHIKL